MIEIKSSLLNDEDFHGVKASIIAASEVDNKEKFRVKLVEYINDSADNNHDMFFYDMLEFLRFLKPGGKDIAYTTPDKLIFMNAPHEDIGENIRQWDFIYCHECLHQLWDTFAVGDKIKKEGIEYNHKLLNIASDCVINDYLSAIRKKDAPSVGIMPEKLKEKFNIDYDRKNDTQFTLYLKLLEKKDEVQDDEELDDMLDQMGGEGDDNQQGGESNSKNKQGSGNGQGDSSEDGDSSGDGQEGASSNKDGKEGKGSGKDGEEQESDKDGDGSSKDSGKEDKDGDKKASKGKGSSKDGDEEGNDSEGGKKAGKGSGGDDIYTNNNKKKAESVIEKYRNKISGDFGQFIRKCKASFDMSRSGLETQVHKGGSSWNQLLSQYTNAFVKKKVFQKKRQYESTYSRVKRGSGFVEFGKPIEQGRKVKDQKMTIDAAFYIDRSGSMSSCIEGVFDACYTIAESLKRQFGKEKIVEQVTFKMFAFNDSMKEVKFGSRVNASGGTMSFDSILNFMSKNTKNYLINIIITDAEFDIDKDKIDTFIKDIDGMVSFITNNDTEAVKNIAKKHKDQLFYILADRNFNVK